MSVEKVVAHDWTDEQIENWSATIHNSIYKGLAQEKERE